MVRLDDNLFASVVEALPFPVQVIRYDGEVIYENAAFRTRFGSSAEARSAIVSALRGGRSSAMRAALGGASRVVPLGPIAGTPFEAHYFPLRDGSSEIAHVGVAFIELRAETVPGPPLSADSVTGQNLLYILDQMPQLVWATRPDGYHDFYNRRWYEYTGADAADTRGAGWNDPVHPDDQERAWARWAHSLKTGEDYEIEYRFRGADGRYRWFLGRALPIRDEGGRIVRWVGTCTEVDEQKRLEAERAQLLAEAEANSRMKDEFLATVSHELRTPLTAILGWARMLRERPELTEKALPIIERNASAQAKLIEEVLETSRVVTGKVQLFPQQSELNDIVRAALDTIRPTAEAKKVGLELSLASHLPPVLCDPERMEQVFLNLLVNAVKFTSAGGRVCVRTFAVGETEVGLEVSDTGRGIAPDFLPYVFERFRQADSSITRRHGGLGLGLSIVKHLVELHSGSVRASSEGEAKGASFEVRLPVTVASPLRCEVRGKLELDAPPAGSIRLDDVRVLVVDDEHDARELVATVLREAGAKTSEADSGAAAIEALAGGEVDVLVSDIGMPIQDGYGLLREIRSRPAEHGGKVPAIALSAFTRGEDVERARAAGFDLHLPKPVEPQDLIGAVHRLACSRAAHADLEEAR